MKYKLNFLLFLSLNLVCSKLAAKNYIDYFKLTGLAKYKLYLGQADSCIYYLNMAFRDVPYVYGYDNFIMAVAYSKLRQNNKSYEYLRKAIKEGIPNIYVNNSDFPYVFDNPQQLQQVKDDWNIEYNNWLKYDKKQMMDSVYYYMYNEMYFIDDSKDYVLRHGKEFLDTSIESHEVIEERLLKYILKNGWNGYRQNGIDMFYLDAALHMTASQLEILLGFLPKELESGNITPDEYGAIYDRHLFNTHPYLQISDCRYCIFSGLSSKNWLSVKDNRKAIGANIYLDGPDYLMFQRLNRKPFFW